MAGGASWAAGGGACCGARRREFGVRARPLQLGEDESFILQNHEALDDVLELADVARPRIVEQRVPQRVRGAP